MDLDQLVSDSFTAHEHLAPSESELLSGIRQRLERRPGARRPVAVAATVGLIAAATIGTTILVGHGAGQGAGAARLASAAAPPATAPQGQASHPLVMPFDLGGLPAGAVTYHAERINSASDGQRVFYDGEYLLTVTTSTGPLDVDVQQLPGPLGAPAFKCGTGQPVTIAGRPGLEGANAGGDCGYEVYFTDSAGGTMYVDVALPDHAAGQPARLRSVGRQVASAIRFPGSTAVTPTFGLGRLPAGLRMVSFDVEVDDGSLPADGGASGTTTLYGLAPSVHSVPVVTAGTDDQRLTGTAGRPVQGHPTVVQDVKGVLSLGVQDAVDGAQVVISGSVPLSELYAIADHLRL